MHGGFVSTIMWIVGLVIFVCGATAGAFIGSLITDGWRNVTTFAISSGIVAVLSLYIFVHFFV